MKRFTKHFKNEKGLTLIELLAVIVILAIIAAIAVPAIGNIINNSRDKALLADASNILAGAKIASVDGACGVAGDKGAISCTEENLKSYVENIKAGKKYSATFNGTEWSVSYDGLGEIKNKTKFTVTSPVKESDLNTAMQK